MRSRVVIVDDERLARVALRSLLEARDDIEIVGEANSVASAATRIEELKPDVIFLDIEMPDGLGFDLFNQIEVRAHVIFATAYNQHALRAFEVNALDYIVKPVDPTHIDRALKRIASRGLASPTDPPIPVEQRFGGEDMICLQEASSMKFTRVREIVYISAADDYVEVHLASGYVALVNERLRRWELILPTSFVRTHRSTLVNIEFIEKMERIDGAWSVQLRFTSESLPMSRRYAQSLKKSLHLHLIG